MDTNSMKTFDGLMHKQEQLILDFEEKFGKFQEERKAKKENHQVLKNYESERRNLWFRINQLHRRLSASELPQGYIETFDRITILNEEFKTSLKEIAMEQSLLLKIDEKEPSLDDHEDLEANTSEAAATTVISNKEDNDKSQEFTMTKSKTGISGSSVETDQNEISPKTSNVTDANISINGSTSKGAIPKVKYSNMTESNTSIIGSNKQELTKNQHTDVTDTILSINRQSRDNSTESTMTGKSATSMSKTEPIAETGITEAMTAIVSLVNQQFKYMSETQASIMQDIKKGDKESLKPQKLEIPTFNGDILSYKTFKDLFLKAVSKCQWSKLELMMLLKTKLTDRALKRVSHLAVEDYNYDKMWTILDAEFLVTRTIIQHNIKNLMDQSQVKFNDVEAMRGFYSNLTTITTNLKQLTDVDPADWLFEIAYLQLEDPIRRRFEDYLQAKGTAASTDSITKFLMSECNVLEAQQMTNIYTPKNRHPQQSAPKKISRVHTTMQNDAAAIKAEPEYTCFICKLKHNVNKCPILLSDNNRVELLKHFKICIYCLKHKYNFKRPCSIKDTITCEKCKKNHHTLLHPLSTETTSMLTKNEEEEFLQMTNQYTSSFVTKNTNKTTILPTALANVLDNHGITVPIVCMIDSCSERTYISTDVAQKMRLKQYKTNIIIKGLNNITDTARTYVKLQIQLSDPTLEIITTNALVVPKIASNIPVLHVDMNMFSGKKLANPYVNQVNQVGILLGGDLLPKIFKSGSLTEVNNGLIMQDTKLGWIISGQNAAPMKTVSTFINYNESFYKSISDEQLNDQIYKFFELPELMEDPEEENTYCRKLFEEKHYQDDSGRYVVPIPWRLDKPKIGHSYRKALRFYLWQEKNLDKNPEHKKMSNDFMNEYLELKHMSPVPRSLHGNETGHVYYVPYLSVFRKDALTTKLRNVFNASSPSSNNVSYNDLILAGPKCQTDLVNILTTARTFKYIVSADIEKCFRQILVLPDDAKTIRIIWRPSPLDTLQEYQLDTLVYGVICSPYLAISTINQVAKDHSQTEEIQKLITNSFYLDDWISGADTIANCKKLVSDVRTVMEAGKLKLTKFNSNNPAILEDVEEDRKISAYTHIDTNKFKTLGLIYHVHEDALSVNIKPIKLDDIKYTKRGISSLIASSYDPLGFLMPFIVVLRLFLQKLWATKLNWDDQIPEELKQQFTEIYTNIHKLAEVKIPRWINSTKLNYINLVGFSDTSKLAMAAVIYSRVHENGEIKTNLVASKARLNKLQTQAVQDSRTETIPKQELKSLLLLAELFQHIKKCFDHLTTNFTAYVDSKIVIYWIRDKKPNKNRYVQKTLEKIRCIINPGDVHYVPTASNPADVATRHVIINQFVENKLWFNGPDLLRQNQLPQTTNEDLKKSVPDHSYSLKIQVEPEDMFKNFSNLNRLIRATAFILKWRTYKKTNKDKNTKFTAEDIQYARKAIIKYYQNTYLQETMSKIELKQVLPKTNIYRKLSPFIDEERILRVGGRLQNSTFLSKDQVHPIIIPKCHLLTLLLRFVHQSYHHARHSLMQRIIVEMYHIPALKSNIHRIITKCPSCIRWTGKPIQPEMAQLPIERIQVNTTWNHVGVDLSGHFFIKSSVLRNAKILKCYVVVFICLFSKSVHLDLVPAMGTEEFLRAFSRFCSRRSTPSTVLSDHGTNLVGCNKILKEEWTKICKNAQENLALKEVKWRLIPRLSPHFGSLYECVMKSMKFFTKRMANIKNLTYEQFETLLLKIEFYLNCRPLYTMNHKDIDNYCLTPFHFILMKAGTIHPIELIHEKIPLTKKWLQLVNLQKLFWRKFINEYLHTLQKKNKWDKPEKGINLNDIVLVKTHNETPADYRLAKVVEIFPDPYDTVRKVKIEYANRAKYIHSVHQLIPFNAAIEEPIQNINIPHVDTELELSQNSTIASNPTQKIITKEVMPHVDEITTPKQAQQIKKKKTKQPITNTITPIELPLKRRLRSNKKYMHTNITILMCFALTCVGAQISYLPPGTHTFTASDVQMIESYDTIYIYTGMKPHNDQLTLQTKIMEFKHDCLHNNPTLKDYCTYWENLIDIEFIQFKSLINNYIGRSKRSISLAFPLIKSGAKLIPHIITGIALISQQNQITQLNNDLEQNQQKLNKTIDLQNQIEDKKLLKNQILIQNVENSQALVTQRQMIHEKGQVLLDLISLTIINYLNINQKSFINEINEHLKPDSLSKLPKLSNKRDIFKISQRSELIRDKEIVIKLKIPLVKNYSCIAIVSVPDENRDIIIPTKQVKPACKIIIDKRTNQYIQLSHAEALYESVYQRTNFLAMSACLNNILHYNNTSTCEKAKLENTTDQILSLSKTTVLIFNEKSNSTVKCNNQVTELLHAFYVAKLPKNCTIYTYSHNYSTGTTLSIMKSYSLNLTNIELSPPNIVTIQDTETIDIVDKQIESLKNSLRNIMGSVANVNITWNWGLIGFISIVTVFAIIKCIPTCFTINAYVNNPQVTD